jgi:hypothetical protein
MLLNEELLHTVKQSRNRKINYCPGLVLYGRRYPVDNWTQSDLTCDRRIYSADTTTFIMRVLPDLV